MTVASTSRSAAAGRQSPSRGTAVDRWTSGPCDALGHRFRVVVRDCPDPVLVDRMRAVTEPLAAAVPAPVTYRVEPAAAAGPGRRPLALRRDGETVCSGTDAATTARFLAWDVNQRAVAAARTAHTVLHAAAASRDGRAVLLAAPMEHGKTTTVAGLLMAGWDYVTDEAVAVHRGDLRISPFPKALCLDPGSWPLFPRARPSWPWAERDAQWHVPVSRLGASAASGTVTPGLLLLPAYRPGVPTAAKPVSPAAAVSRLARCTFGFPGGGAEDLEVLVRLAGSCPAYELTIGDLRATVALADELDRRHGTS